MIELDFKIWEIIIYIICFVLTILVYVWLMKSNFMKERRAITEMQEAERKKKIYEARQKKEEYEKKLQDLQNNKNNNE